MLIRMKISESKIRRAAAKFIKEFRFGKQNRRRKANPFLTFARNHFFHSLGKQTKNKNE